MRLTGTLMALTLLESRPEFEGNKKFSEAFTKFNTLVSLLTEKALPDEFESRFNLNIDALNTSAYTVKALSKSITKLHHNILVSLEKELKIVTKNHYRNTWLAIGIGAFGVPLGVVFGVSLDNMGLIGLGMPIGLAMGIGVGTQMDNTAHKEGRQLDME